MFARLSASRPHAPLTDFCGGATATTLLSSGLDSALLPLLPTRALLRLRATCREARAATARHPHAEGRLGPDASRCCAAYFAAFLCATAANCAGLLREGAPAPTQAELACLARLRVLHLAGASEAQLERVRAALPGALLLGPPPLPADPAKARGAPKRIRRELLDIGKDGPPHCCALAVSSSLCLARWRWPCWLGRALSLFLPHLPGLALSYPLRCALRFSQIPPCSPLAVSSSRGVPP
jgi:hypothetical protein